MLFRVAEELGKGVWEIEAEMPCSELDEWFEWFRMKAEAERKARREAEQKAKSQPRRRR